MTPLEREKDGRDGEKGGKERGPQSVGSHRNPEKSVLQNVTLCITAVSYSVVHFTAGGHSTHDCQHYEVQRHTKQLTKEQRDDCKNCPKISYPTTTGSPL